MEGRGDWFLIRWDFFVGLYLSKHSNQNSPAAFRDRFSQYLPSLKKGNYILSMTQLFFKEKKNLLHPTTMNMERQRAERQRYKLKNKIKLMWKVAL